MTSNDYVLRLNTLELSLRELISVNREQIAEMKTLAANLQKDNAEFQTLMIKNFADFKESVNNNLKEIHSEIGQIHQRMTGVEHDISGLYHWDYWLLSIILVVFAMPQIITGVKALFSAISDGLNGVISVFRKGNDAHSK